MNNKHRKTLKAILASPTSGAILWSDIESLLIALGAEKREGEGSRVRFLYNQEMLNTHKSHPGKEAKKYQVEAVRDFLKLIGVKL